MPYVPLDVEYFDDERICELSPNAVLVHIACMLIARAAETDGELTIRQLQQKVPAVVPDLDELLKELENAVHGDGRPDDSGLVIRVGERGLFIPGYLKRNPSRLDCLKRRAKNTNAGNASAAKRAIVAEEHRLAVEAQRAPEAVAGELPSSDPAPDAQQQQQLLAGALPSGQPPATNPQPKTRTQLCFDAFVEVCGMDPQKITRTERGRINRAIKDLGAKVAPGEIRRRGANYKLLYPRMPVTPQAIEGNWSHCATVPNGNGHSPASAERVTPEVAPFDNSMWGGQ